MTDDKLSPSGWQISFIPDHDFFHHGKDPLIIFNELADLGELIVSVDEADLPLFSELAPKNSYLAWQLVLKGDITRQEIESVFSSVSQYCQLRIESLPTIAEQTIHTQQKSAIVFAPQYSNLLTANEAKLAKLTRVMNKAQIDYASLAKTTAFFVDQQRSPWQQQMVALGESYKAAQEAIVDLHYSPIGIIFGDLTRWFNKLAETQGKKVVVNYSGEQTQLRNNVLMVIAELLASLLQNSLPSMADIAALELNVSQQANQVLIEVLIEGTGIDEQAVDKIRDGYLTDVFANTIELELTQNENATYTIRLPIHLGVLNGQLVSVEDETYILPVDVIVEALAISSDEIISLTDKGEVYAWQGQFIPVLYLHQLLSKYPARPGLEQVLLVVEINHQPVGVLLDEMGEQQLIYSQSLATHYQNIDGISAAAIMQGEGIAMVLDIAYLIESYRKSTKNKFVQADDTSNVA